MGLIIILLLFAGITWYSERYLSVKERQGTIPVLGRDFTYQIGDRLIPDIDFVNHITHFNGLVVNLPKNLPHIYLDGHKTDRVLGARFSISRGNKVSLEGDFDKHFQLYAPEGYTQLALSIISPDVMQTLIDTAADYDIEIKGSRLHIISRQRIFDRIDREAKVLQTGEQVLAEIAHRLQSWSVEDAHQAQLVDLKMTDDPSVKFGRRAVRSAWILAVPIGLFFTIPWLIYAVAVAKNTLSTITVILGAGICMAFPFAVIQIYTVLQDRYPEQLEAFFRFMSRWVG